MCPVCRINPIRDHPLAEYCSVVCEKKSYRVLNHDAYLAAKKRYREKNKEKIAAYGKNYKSLVKYVDRRIADELKANHSCLKCETKRSLEVHHIKHQLYGGGPNDLNNLLVLCKSCHALWHRMFNVAYWNENQPPRGLYPVDKDDGTLPDGFVSIIPKGYFDA